MLIKELNTESGKEFIESYILSIPRREWHSRKRRKRRRKSRSRPNSYLGDNFIKSFELFRIQHFIWNLIYSFVRSIVGASILEPIIRIPVSLKIETDSSFYTDFVAVMRDNKELSEFIVNIMRAYYEHPHIKEQVDAVLFEYTPEGKIFKQIERIHASLSKSLAVTGMLRNQVSNTQEVLQGGSFPASSVPAVIPESVQQRLDQHERALLAVSEKLDFLISKLQQGDGSVNGNPSPSPSPSASAPVTSTVSSVPREVQSDPVVPSVAPSSAPSSVPSALTQSQIPIGGTTDNAENSEVTNPYVEVNRTPQMEMPKNPPVAPPVVVDDGESTEVTVASEDSASRSNLPANFLKLAKSVKKKG